MPQPPKQTGPKAGFDSAASSYDKETATNPAMNYMRQVSLRILKRCFRPGERLLEIGCGTAKEALALAREGIEILATDPSAEMLKIAKQKIAQAKPQAPIRLRQLAASELDKLLAPERGLPFDGAYSSFGPLNGERDLRPVGKALYELVRPGGLVVLSIMNRFYLLETLWYLSHLAPGTATRRWSGQAMVPISSGGKERMLTYYHTPRAVLRAFRGFERVSCRALPLLLPPPYLARLWERWPSLWPKLLPIEEKLSSWQPLCALGDHFVLILRRAGKH